MTAIKCYCLENYDGSCFACALVRGFYACKILTDGSLRQGFCPFYKTKEKYEKGLGILPVDDEQEAEHVNKMNEIQSHSKCDIKTIISLLEHGYTNEYIAEVVGCSKGNISQKRMKWIQGEYD